MSKATAAKQTTAIFLKGGLDIVSSKDKTTENNSSRKGDPCDFDLTTIKPLNS